MQTKRRFAVLTCGGDCPGLNAVIRAVVKTFLAHDCEIYGVLNGFRGLVEGNIVQLTRSYISGILPRGGTILGTSNADNPFNYIHELPDGTEKVEDRHEDTIANLKKLNIEALVLIGGDGSLHVGDRLTKECGINVVVCPKTIDNDLGCTERTFGFETAVETACEAVDRLHTTAESHHRVMVLEVMGRYAGWIALEAGLAGGADVILLPEIPYDINSVAAALKERKEKGKNFSIVVVAEGAKPIGGNYSVARVVPNSVESIRLGGAGERLVNDIEKMTGLESRCTVLGYLQRGGSPVAFDRILSTRYGVGAALSCLDRKYNVMMALVNDEVVSVPIEQVLSKVRSVPIDGQLLQTAREMGICFGD